VGEGILSNDKGLRSESRKSATELKTLKSGLKRDRYGREWVEGFPATEDRKTTDEREGETSCLRARRGIRRPLKIENPKGKEGKETLHSATKW